MLNLPPADYLIANQFAYSEPVPIVMELDIEPIKEAVSTPEAVKEMIVRYAKEYGINPILAVNIARAESELNPLAKNKNSSASGIYQIIKGTWKDFKCEGDIFNAEDNIKCGLKIMKISGIRHWNASRDIWFALNKNS